MGRSAKYALLILALLVGAFYLRFPTINQGMPYFYDEDEAHHFNRTMNMAKSGDYNPHYFHKPSLHFYLRMPVVFGAYLWAKQHGYLKSLNEVRTYNRFGIADYAFTASHPTFVKWNRAWSVLLSLLLIVFTVLIAWEVTSSGTIALASGTFSAISPALVEYSGVIGVDVLMSVMCLASVYFGIRLAKNYSLSALLLSSIFAGLAVSSKYNAAPIGIAPLVGLYFSGHLTFRNFLKTAGLSLLAFFSASPYILISFGEFLEDLKYEIWHYSVAGHVGHMAEPGLEQVKFYMDWFADGAVGFALFGFALCGLPVLIYRSKRTALPFLAFPILFFLLMIAQKANFVRNMLVMIPFLSILAASFGFESLKVFRSKGALYTIGAVLFFLGCAYQPIRQSLELRKEITSVDESRNHVSEWLTKNNFDAPQTALAGDLQLPLSISTLKNFTTVEQQTAPPLLAYILGYDRIVYRSDTSFNKLKYLKLEASFDGVGIKERIIRNPAVSIYTFTKEVPFEEVTVFLNGHPGLTLTDQCAKGLPANPGFENYCWATSRYFILLPGSTSNEYSMEVMSPWAGQEVNIFDDSGILLLHQSLPTAGEWTAISVTFPPSSTNTGELYFMVSKVASPSKELSTTDTRRLSLAIKKISPTK